MLFEIFLIAIVVAIACAIPGVFLVIRGTTMLSDAITHSVLLGIVLAFLGTKDLNSPLLLIGATLIGVLAVWIIEALQKTKLMPDDAAIGVVFPFFFSLGIILITRFAEDVHLDTDAVMMGELAFAPFRRLYIAGVDLGPTSLWTMVVILLINLLFIILFYKELKVATFDPLFAASVGFSPTIIHYALMTLVSLTAVGAYDTVGSILVVGFMVGPALTGYLLTDNLVKMFGIAIITAIINSVIGVGVGFYLDVSLTGMLATVTGITAFMTFLFSPKKGWISKRVEHRKQTAEFKKWYSEN